VIAVDTNILVYAHRSESDWYEAAFAVLRSLAEGDEPWAIPWPCIHEFLSVVTNRKIYSPPSTTDQAFAQLREWLRSPSARLIGESRDHLAALEQVVQTGKLTGAEVHDARIAAICTTHGIRELWSVDRGFTRMPRLKTRNPFVGRR